MYSRYRGLYSPGYTFRYPNYGYGFGTNYSSSRRRWDYSDYDTSSYYDTYRYGRSRRRPHYWERDRDMISSWGRNTIRTRTPSPPRTETLPPPPPPIPEIPKEELVKKLHVKDVDLHISENTEKHKTDEYACTKKRTVNKEEMPAELVVRRGDKIKMTITFDRPFSKENDDLQLCFSIGKDPKPTKGTQAQFEIDETGKQTVKPDQWGASLQGKTGNDVTILVSIPANCIIGEWNFSIKTISEGKDKDGNEKTLVVKYEYEDDITILFNPWCINDGVYMATSNLLDEYILNEDGAVWRGNFAQMGAKKWNFGQFEEQILEIALQLVRSGFNPNKIEAMADPVRVSRMVAKMVNSSDDKGILEGNWSGNYEGGTSPTAWVGSIKILRQWKKSGPVKYGQCWVFSCVTTTVCRALGIPCRTVTNFASAHDTDMTYCIEKYFNASDGEKIPSGDSVWNFHVWNEVWMARPDLVEPSFPVGWQVIDSTPQEASDGVYTCGPCPVVALKKGLCNVSYDAGFVYAEVNADVVHWNVYNNDRLERKELYTNKVGKKISTKKPTGGPFEEDPDWSYYERKRYSEDMRQDLTLEYKPREGSKEERETAMTAHRLSSKAHPDTYKDIKRVQSVKFTLLHDNDAMIGSKMDIEFKAKSEGSSDRKINGISITVRAASYTGEGNPTAIHHKRFGSHMLEKGEEMVFRTVIEPDDYLDYLVEQASVVITARAYVEPVDDEEEQSVIKEHVVRFIRPDLHVKCPRETTVGDNVTFIVSLVNPIDRPLTKCKFSMESVGFEDLDDYEISNIPSKEEHIEEFVLPAMIAKKNAAVYFSFECEEIPDISGSAIIKILRK